MKQNFFGIVLVACLSLSSFIAGYSQDLRSRIEANHKIYVPEGNGPFPVVIAVPGCSGVSLNGAETDTGRPGDEGDRLFRRHYSRMAARLQRAGFMVMLVDYLAAEGVANTCGWEIHPKRVGDYVGEALSYVKSYVNGDTTSIHVMGWSHGGEGVLAWLANLDEEYKGVQSAITVYPGCSTSKPWKSPIPLLMLLGDEDDIAIPGVCHALVLSLEDQDHVKVLTYPNARHGFDLTEGPEVLSVGDGLTIGRNPVAGESAWKEIIQFLKQ